MAKNKLAVSDSIRNNAFWYGKGVSRECESAGVEGLDAHSPHESDAVVVM
jgi:hypothetical protein